ncbi:3'-5' exonuclease [Streptomyces sp. ISL-87]|uniref:3'-5' exonuclease n=1 Tax=Streptomyces sp. ISL-87 TaxID=2819188 RepID=UPI001BE916A6|nr:3'-5' exonuclease [Streptomyces sp. ISL-87]MBT2613640.1 3'-5' exonuclease [Streptomyces sp. ISL-87]
MKTTDWPDRLFVVDVEGNGANPPDLVEIALIPIQDGEAVPERGRQWLIQPPVPIPPRITRINGISNDMTAGAPAWREVAGEVRSLLDGAWIAAHSASVEYNVLTRHLPDWQPAGVIDTLRLAKAADPGQRGYGLDPLIARTGIDVTGIPGKRHRAAYDAHATALLLLRLADRFVTWHDLTAAAVPPNMPGRKADAPHEESTLW